MTDLGNTQVMGPVPPGKKKEEISDGCVWTVLIAIAVVVIAILAVAVPLVVKLWRWAFA